jgi:hypothetical protein
MFNTSNWYQRFDVIGLNFYPRETNTALFHLFSLFLYFPLSSSSAHPPFLWIQCCHTHSLRLCPKDPLLHSPLSHHPFVETSTSPQWCGPLSPIETSSLVWWFGQTQLRPAHDFAHDFALTTTPRTLKWRVVHGGLVPWRSRMKPFFLLPLTISTHERFKEGRERS